MLTSVLGQVGFWVADDVKWPALHVILHLQHTGLFAMTLRHPGGQIQVPDSTSVLSDSLDRHLLHSMQNLSHSQASSDGALHLGVIKPAAQQAFSIIDGVLIASFFLHTITVCLMHRGVTTVCVLWWSVLVPAVCSSPLDCCPGLTEGMLKLAPFLTCDQGDVARPCCTRAHSRYSLLWCRPHARLS